MENKMEEILQGDKYLGHPVHPALVAFPIGMLCFGATMDFLSLFTKNECVQEAADKAVTAGLVGASVAAMAGLAEYARVPDNDEAKETVLTHSAVNVSVIALNSVSAIIRNGRRGAGRPGGMLPKLLSWAGISLLTYSGWLGGNLVYNQGVAVDTDRPHRWNKEKPMVRAKEAIKTKMKEREEEIRTHA